jgi:hypothetical protein
MALGRLFFSVWGGDLSHRVYMVNPSSYVATGWLRTSVSDKGSSLDKIWDRLTVITDPLPAGTSVSVQQSLDGGASYLPVSGGTMDTPGATTLDVPLGQRGISQSVEVTLNGTGTATPVLRIIQSRLHPFNLADELIQIPIDCGDEVSDLRGRPLKENGPGAGVARARYLASLAQSRVKYQDIDWRWTGISYICEVVGVEVVTVGTYDRHHGKQRHRQIALVTLRRSLS